MASVYNLNFSTNTSTNFVPLIIFNGESNSGGRALNTDLSTAQLLPRPAVQIFNNTTLVFENLQIGVNNLIAHAGLTDNAGHGWENGLATAVEAGLFTGFSQVYLVKTGQGGSIISNWNVGGAYLNTYISRIQAAKALILNTGKIPLPFFWYSQGINDFIAGSDAATWKTNTIAHFKNLRQYIGYAPIIEPQLMTGQGSYNTYFSDIQVTERYFFTVPSTGTTLNDPNHWSASGMALLASRMVDTTINFIGLDYQNYSSTSLLALSGVTPTTRVTNALFVPLFSLQPTSQTIAEGVTATFSVLANGSPTPTYQWQNQRSGAGAFNNISGATSANYTTGNLSIAADNTDVYRCIASNSQGSVTSGNAILTVAIIPTLTYVAWTDLVGATTGSPSAGYIQNSGGTYSGGRVNSVIDSTQPFAFIYDLTSSDVGEVVYFENTTTVDYTWVGVSPGSRPFVSGMYFLGSSFYKSASANNATLVSTITSFPFKLKVEKSGNNIIYSISYDAGTSYSALLTETNVLSGQTNIYLKTLYAIGNTAKVRIGRLT